MPKTITIKNGTVTLAKTEFKCPKCDHLHWDDKYYNKLMKQDAFIIKYSCKGCKKALRLTLDCKGDVIVIN